MSSTPATSEPAPHSAVAYILPAVHSKRVRVIAADGAEEEADDNPWVRMQLKDPYQQTQQEDAEPAGAGGAAAADGDEGDAAAEAEAEQPKPEEVIKSFAAAKGELEWLMAMLSTLQEGKYLTVGKSERAKDSGQQLLADMAIQTNARFRRRSAAAEAASDALLQGANALRALGQKEDAFYSQVAQLQRYWKVRQEPPGSPYAYSVNLSLSPPDSISSSSNAAAGPDAAAMVGRGPVDVVYILKDPAGNLRVQVPAPKTPGPPTVTFKGVEQPPVVYTGPAAIHALLLRQLRLNAWHMVVSSLDDEVASLLNLPAHLRQLLSAAQQQGAAEGVGSSGAQQQQQQQQAKFAEASGHLTLFASLSSLVLQAVAGAAGTAGEAAALQQHQQQQQQQQVDVMAVDPPAVPDLNGFSLFDLTDVGQPWQRAAALAAARLGPGADWGPVGQQQQQQQQQGGRSDGGSNGSSSGVMPRVVVDPQLLSMRPLALEHLLVTQLGHLVSSLRHTSESAYMAPIAYAAAARQVQDRARQRLQHHQQQQQQQLGGRADDAAGGQAAAAAAAAAAAQLAPKPGSLKFGRQISFLHCFGLWLQHVAQRDVLRGHVDRALQDHPGVVAGYLCSTHFCVSAMQLRRAHVAAADVSGVRQPQQQGAAAAAAAALLLLLSGSQLTIEAPGLAVPAAVAAAAGAVQQGGSSQWLEPAAQSTLTVTLQGVERLLQQLLRNLQ